MEIENPKSKSKIVIGEWLPDMDLNHDKQIQSLLCYRYTIGQTDALERLKSPSRESSRQTLEWLNEPRERTLRPCCPSPGKERGTDS